MNAYIENAINEYLETHSEVTVLDSDDFIEGIEWELMPLLEENHDEEQFMSIMFRDHLYHHQADITALLNEHGITLNKGIPHEEC